MTRCLRTPEVAILALVAALAGCATQSGTVVLLPEADGRPTALQVVQGEGTLLLDRPYAAAEIHSSGPRAATLSGDEVKARFGNALAAQPMRAATFTLHFDEGETSDLLPPHARIAFRGEDALRCSVSWPAA